MEVFRQSTVSFFGINTSIIAPAETEIKKFKKVPEEYIVKLRKRPEYTIDLIATEIFDMEKIEELEKYFQ